MYVIASFFGIKFDTTLINSPYEERRKCYDNHHIFHLLCLLGNFRVEFIKNIYMNEFCTQNITKITPSAFDLIELLCVLKQSNIFCNHDHLKFINKQHTRTQAYYVTIVTPFSCHYDVLLMFQIDTRFKTAQTPQGDLRVAIAGIVLAMVNPISQAFN